MNSPWKIGRQWSSRLAIAISALCVPITANASGQQPLSHAQALNAVHRAQVASPYRLSKNARLGRIRYTLSLTENIDWAWPQTTEQKVSQVGGRVLVTVCASCGTEAATAASEMAPYLESNPWVDSDSPEVLAFARANSYGIRVSGVRIARQMQMLVKAVQKHMTGGIDFRDYASASQALENRYGDCTEYAVLLAAAARARGIPARLVYGLAYASRFTGESHIFSPHVWVQVWDGQRWQSYDAGMGQFDSGHIALFIGDGRIEPLSAVMNVMQHIEMIDAVGITIVDQESISASLHSQ